MESLWDRAKNLVSNAGKFYDVATNQGFGNAWQLATKGYIPRGDMNTHSEQLVKYEETTDAWKEVVEWLDKGPETFEDNMPGYTDDEVNEMHANRFTSRGQYEVWDDDVFVWRSVTDDERSRDAPIKDMSIMTPTRPGSYQYQYEGITPTNVEEYSSLKEFDDQSPPQLQNVQGNWLTPDPGGAGLIFTDEKQPTSIDQFKRIWGSGDPVEGNFMNEGLYNLLFEDAEGDVSIVKALDQFNALKFPMGGGVTNEAVARAIKALNPENIYYMDAGMNQDFFYDSYLPESVWGNLQGPGIKEGYFPYTHTGGMVGKKIKGRGN